MLFLNLVFRGMLRPLSSAAMDRAIQVAIGKAA
jgi:hypothetical protein